MKLFGQRKRRRVAEPSAPASPLPAPLPSSPPSSAPATPAEATPSEPASTFAELGLREVVLRATRAMGYARPTPIQQSCVPDVLSGLDVIGCAETGSGKTAAFALPLLQRLSLEPYGVFCIVLTPTRELAMQISEQFAAFGVGMDLRLSTVIGGVDMVQQALDLARRPHVVVATPGRLADHIRSTAPPFLKNLGALVLDEADRLLTGTFTPDLQTILGAIPSSTKRQTLLFSATFPEGLEGTSESLLGLRSPRRHDVTAPAQRMPRSLQQQYVFMPEQLKLAYLVHLLNELTADGLRRDSASSDAATTRTAGGPGNASSDEDDDAAKTSAGLPRAASAILFVNTCKAAAETHAALAQLRVPCVALHSILGQRRRNAALGTFKSHQIKLLVATDVASRGLDIPTVDLVIHVDLPRDPADYVHRCGRAARAGRWGRSVALVSQFDVQLVHAIEKMTATPMVACAEAEEDAALKLLNPVAKALRTARVELEEVGFMERLEQRRQRNKRRRRDVTT